MYPKIGAPGINWEYGQTHSHQDRGKITGEFSLTNIWFCSVTLGSASWPRSVDLIFVIRCLSMLQTHNSLEKLGCHSAGRLDLPKAWFLKLMMTGHVHNIHKTRWPAASGPGCDPPGQSSRHFSFLPWKQCSGPQFPSCPQSKVRP